MEISSNLLEEKAQELLQLITRTPSEERTSLLEKLSRLTDIQKEYNALCERYELEFETQMDHVDILISFGAVKQSYFNFKDAVRANLIECNKPITLSFPNMPFPDVETVVLPNNYVKNRTIARQFYGYYNKPEDSKFRLTKLSSNHYSVELVG